MRSFEARGDCDVWDEPFYGYFLKQTGINHPAREQTLAEWPHDPVQIAKDCAGPAPTGKPVFFQKHMCQHILDELDLNWTTACRHIFLIRDPGEVAASFYATAGFARTEDLGAVRQLKLYDQIKALTGRDWPIIEGADVLESPGEMLAKVCAAIDLDYTDAMLSWPEGRRDTDGPWAVAWYKRVEASTGFEKPQKSPHVLPAELEDTVKDSTRAYLALRKHKLTHEL